VAELYLKGTRKQVELAAAVGVTQACISKDLALLAAEWKGLAIKDFDLARTQELERLDRVEQAAWAAWERSVGQKQETTRITDSKTPKTTQKTWFDAGDPRLLGVVTDVINRRCEILGLDAPEKHAILHAEVPDEMDPEYLALAQEIGRRRKEAKSGKEPAEHGTMTKPK
jgi:hypothetical protein